MESLIATQKVILEEFEKLDFFDREVFQTFSLSNSITGVVGSRGVGKTTFLLDQALQKGAREGKALYVVADNTYFLENRLVDLVKHLYEKTEVEYLFIDEVHKYENWIQELKNISDIYKSIKIVFSGSSVIDLIKSKYDLSRRVTLYELGGLSFREYLEFVEGIKLPGFSLDELLGNHTVIAQKLGVSKVLLSFERYLKHGYYPYLHKLETGHQRTQALENGVEKTIYEDIAVAYKLKTTSLKVIERLFKFVLNSPPGELSAYKLAKNLGKDYETIVNYLEILVKANLLTSLYKKTSGHAFSKSPEKLYPENTNLFSVYNLPLDKDAYPGKAREVFFVSQLRNAGYNVFYSKKGDFQVDEYGFEVGGKNKNLSQVVEQPKGYLAIDDIEVGVEKQIPLYLFGLLDPIYYSHVD